MNLNYPPHLNKRKLNLGSYTWCRGRALLPYTDPMSPRCSPPGFLSQPWKLCCISSLLLSLPVSCAYTEIMASSAIKTIFFGKRSQPFTQCVNGFSAVLF
ncbi:hypothetical protein ILYODFUR_006839 [Ilyodon furcidens]|uniref:Uncharacterized protein n=1 Tax=Ilyodon furcidens TaxID=33524 RepID=A0ABV0VC76_9TELE